MNAKCRTGIGFDVHPLVPERALVLGGVTIPYPRGLKGHSDGDALTHAIIDALLGAACLRDIGTHFPPGDPQFKDAVSVKLLDETVSILHKNGWQPAYVDATIIAEKPSLSPYIDQIRMSLATHLKLSTSLISVKAKSTNGLGFIGRGEGISAMAVATIEELAG